MTSTLTKLFDDVAAGIGLGPPIDRATVAHLKEDLAAALDDVADHLPRDARTLTLTKGRIRAVLACETGALAVNEVVPEVTPAMILGHLVDRLVAAHVVTGEVPAQPFEHAIAALRAERDERALAWLDSADPEVIRVLRADLVARAAQVESSWPRVRSEWWPRPEDSARIPFADGRIVLSGRFDLMLGGRPTPLDRVVVEVKSGAATAVHQPDLYWYGLLGALRDGVAPRVVAVWSAADGQTTTAPISADGLRSAAMRVIDAAEHWAALLSGRAPTVTAHPGCRWCALLEVCETGQGWSPERADGEAVDDRDDDEGDFEADESDA